MSEMERMTDDCVTFFRCGHCGTKVPPGKHRIHGASVRRVCGDCNTRNSGVSNIVAKMAGVKETLWHCRTCKKPVTRWGEDKDGIGLPAAMSIFGESLSVWCPTCKKDVTEWVVS